MPEASLLTCARAAGTTSNAPAAARSNESLNTLHFCLCFTLFPVGWNIFLLLSILCEITDLQELSVHSFLGALSLFHSKIRPESVDFELKNVEDHEVPAVEQHEVTANYDMLTIWRRWR